MTYRAITLHAPWATLLFTRQPTTKLGHPSDCVGCIPPPFVKRFETRPRPCPPSIIGQRVAFHQGKRLYDRCVVEGFADVLGSPWPILPLGAVLGTGIVTACYPIVAHLSTADRDCPFPCVAVTESRDYLYVIRGRNGHEDITNISDQLPYGDFTPGRYAWLIEDAAPTTERCPWCEGHGRSATNPADNPEGRFENGVWCIDCPICDGIGVCEPIPAKGKQGWWHWTPNGGET